MGVPYFQQRLGRLLIVRLTLDEADAERGLCLLKAAYRNGSRQAGYELSSLPANISQDRSGLSLEETVSLLEERAMKGWTPAALTLAYQYFSDIGRDRLLAVLRANADNSGAASRILAEIEAEQPARASSNAV